jgi:predicted RNA-binding Zn-ribbon protein involved in translation (DUF1610 family)
MASGTLIAPVDTLIAPADTLIAPAEEPLDDGRAPNERHPTMQRIAMKHACCPSCRIRFTPAAAAHLVACPQCGEPLQRADGLKEIVGFRLFTLEDVPHTLPEAVAVSMPVPDPGAGRTVS